MLAPQYIWIRIDVQVKQDKEEYRGELASPAAEVHMNLILASQRESKGRRRSAEGLDRIIIQYLWLWARTIIMLF